MSTHPTKLFTEEPRSHSYVIVSATVSAFVSWVFLNRHTFRGDRVILFYFAAFTLLKYFLQTPLAYSFSVLAMYFVSLAAITVIYRISPFHSLASFPGPLVWSISSIKHVEVSFGGLRHLVLDDLHKKYGKFVRIGPNALSVNSSTVKNMIYGSSHYMTKGDSYNKPGRLGGVAMFFKQNKNDHAKRKKIWANAFTGSAVEKFFPILENRTWQLTECIERRKDKSDVVNLGECLAYWSYDFMGEMVFGGSNNLELMRDGDPEGLVIGGKKATVFLESLGQAPWLMDIVWHLPSGRSMRRLRDVAAAMMRKRFYDREVDIRDLSSYLLEGDTNTGEQIPLYDLEQDAVVAIQAGSDNTSTSIALAIYFMLAHPVTYRSLQSLLESTFTDHTAPLDPHTLASISFLDAVINESMRLSTPFFLPRVVPQGGVTMDGKYIPEGTTIALAAHSQQVSEENFYPDPMVFRPDRWMPGGLGEGSRLNRAALVPFSFGQYICIAKSFAMQEMRLVIARLLLTFDMSFPPSFDVEEFWSGFRNMRTTYFNTPLMVKITRRVPSVQDRNP